MATTQYHILINEEQRKILLKGLRAIYAFDNVEELDERNLLVDMLKGLPEEEKKSPHVIHGLCL